MHTRPCRRSNLDIRSPRENVEPTTITTLSNTTPSSRRSVDIMIGPRSMTIAGSFFPSFHPPSFSAQVDLIPSRFSASNWTRCRFLVSIASLLLNSLFSFSFRIYSYLHYPGTEKKPESSDVFPSVHSVCACECDCGGFTSTLHVPLLPSLPLSCALSALRTNPRGLLYSKLDASTSSPLPPFA